MHKKYDDGKFTERLANLLQDQRVTNKHIANLLGVSEQAVGNWTKTGYIEYLNLRKIAEFLNVDWVWLRYGPTAMQNYGTRATTETNLKRREQIRRIKENEERLSKCLEIANIGTFEHDLLTGIVIWSDTTYKLFNVTKKKQLSLEYVISLIHKNDRELFSSAIDYALDNPNEECVIEFRVPLPKGKVRKLRAIGQVVFDSKGLPDKVLGLFIDDKICKPMV